MKDRHGDLPSIAPPANGPTANDPANAIEENTKHSSPRELNSTWSKVILGIKFVYGVKTWVECERTIHKVKMEGVSLDREYSLKVLTIVYPRFQLVYLEY